VYTNPDREMDTLNLDSIGHVSAQESSMREDLIKVFRSYTGRDYSTINNIMREPETSSCVDFDCERYLHVIRSLGSFLKSAPYTKYPYYIWRGVANMDWFEQVKCGDLSDASHYRDKAFISCTADFRTALVNSSNSCCIMQIRVPTGYPLLSIAPFSAHPDEEEVLINRSTVLRCISKRHVTLHENYNTVTEEIPITEFDFMNQLKENQPDLSKAQQWLRARNLYEDSKKSGKLTRQKKTTKTVVKIIFANIVM